MNYKKERQWNKIRKTIHEKMRDVTKVKIIKKKKKKKTRTLKNTMNKLKSTIESVNKKNGSEEKI